MNPEKVAAALLSFLVVVPSASAFVSYVNDAGQPQRWNLTNPIALVHTNVLNRSTRAVRYFLAADAFSSANRAAELEAARACFDQWQGVPGSILRFEEGGLISGQVDVNTTDNTNVVFWAKTSLMVNGGWDNISGTTGVTFSDYLTDSTLLEADIVLNGIQFSWFTDFSNTINQAQFVESVLLHEIGHFIGLSHSPAGAATLYPRGGGGINVQAGLSSDDIAGVHALYPSPALLPALARVSGQLTFRGSGSPVFGGVLCAEDARGNLVAGTLTGRDGRYDMPAMPPGQYQVRATPMDPNNASSFLLRGRDVDFAGLFNSAETNFLPATNAPVTLTAGAKATVNVSVLAGTPALRINRVWPPTADPSIYVVVGYPIAIPSGEREFVTGVYSTAIPSPNAILRITGDGLTFGPTTVTVNAFTGLNLLSVPVHMANGATPGMRSFVVQQGDTLAYANGFLEITPPVPDHNFDGLDDRFQRQHFARWTALEAGPKADPDRDGYNNTGEYIAGTDPTDPASVLRVESVRMDASGATVTWPGAEGKRYQLFSRLPIDGIRGWQPLGAPIVSTGNRCQSVDTNRALPLRFYRIQALP